MTNAKLAKKLRREIRAALATGYVSTRSYTSKLRKRWVNDAGAVVREAWQVLLEPGCPRAIYQRTKRILGGASFRHLIERRDIRRRQAAARLAAVVSDRGDEPGAVVRREKIPFVQQLPEGAGSQPESELRPAAH